MRFRLFLGCVVSLAFSMSSAVEVVDLAIRDERCVCEASAGDRHDVLNRLNFGAYSGQCVDACRFRRSDRLSESGNFVSNFMHGDSYWKAKIPIDAVEGADVGFEEFMPGVFHVFMVFHFPEKRPVVLFPQRRGQGAIRTVRDLVVSPEGVPPREGAYNLFGAYLERYLIGIRLLSKDQMTGWSVAKLKHPVTFYVLKLNGVQLREALRAGLSLGEKTSFRVKYGLFSNNCATNTLDVLDAVLKPQTDEAPFYYRFVYGLERSLPIAGPLGTLHVLKSRGLISSEPASRL